MTRPPANTIQKDICRQTTPGTHVVTDDPPGHRSNAFDERSQQSIDFQGVITNAIEIETLTSQTFRLLQGNFLADHPDASHVFARLADDEADHASVLVRQSDVIRTRPEAFTQMDPSLGQRQRSFICQLRKGVQRIETRAITLDDAIQLSLEIEEGDDRMIADLRESLGTFAFGTILIEVLSIHKHPEHNSDLVTMARERGVGKLPKRECIDATTTAPRGRDDQWPNIHKAMNETRSHKTKPVLDEPRPSAFYPRNMKDITL